MTAARARRATSPAPKPPRAAKPQAPRTPRARTRSSAASSTALQLDWQRIAWIAAAVSIVFGILFVGWTGLYLLRRHSGRGVTVAVAMPRERNADAIAEALAHAHVIDHPWVFAMLLNATGTIEKLPLAPTVLRFRDDLSPRAVLRALAEGSGLVRVTIPEGLTQFDIAQRLVDAGAIDSVQPFLQAMQDPGLAHRLGVRANALEGYLYPDTYDIPPESSAPDVIARMVRNFQKHWDDLAKTHPNVSRDNVHALVTLASIVEKETGSSLDRDRVAAVFVNRLQRPDFTPRLLQTDPTIVYGCRVAHPPSCANADTRGPITITRAMLDDAENPYNTYKHPGLPPGPIANPGTRALASVMQPASSDDLYFVAMGNGRSAFATTLPQHELNVRKYLRKPSVPSK